MPTANHQSGEAQKKASIPQTAGERKAALVALRSRWADVQNEHLARHGHESRVDHRKGTATRAYHVLRAD
nr:MobA/MobL family protein [Shigella flexneri]